MTSALFLDPKANPTSCSAYGSGPVVSPDRTLPTNELQFRGLTRASFPCFPRCAAVLGCETPKRRTQAAGPARTSCTVEALPQCAPGPLHSPPTLPEIPSPAPKHRVRFPASFGSPFTVTLPGRLSCVSSSPKLLLPDPSAPTSFLLHFVSKALFHRTSCTFRLCLVIVQHRWGFHLSGFLLRAQH